MVDEKLVRYVLVARSRGFSDEAIRQRLIQTGWKEYDVDQAFYLSTSPKAASPQKVSPRSINPYKSEEKGFFKGLPPMFLGSLVILGVILVVSTALTFSLIGGEAPEGTPATGAAISAPADNEPAQEEVIPPLENTSSEPNNSQ